LDLTVNDSYLPLYRDQQVFDGVQLMEISLEAFIKGCNREESYGVAMDHGDQVLVGTCKE
jgi:hypothetical protein